MTSTELFRVILSDKQVQWEWNELKHRWHHSFTWSWQSYSVDAETCPPYFEMENNPEKKQKTASWTDVSGKIKGRQTIYFKKSEEENIQNKLSEGHASIGCVLFSDVHVLFIFNLLSKIMKMFFFLFFLFFFFLLTHLCQTLWVQHDLVTNGGWIKSAFKHWTL